MYSTNNTVPTSEACVVRNKLPVIEIYYNLPLKTWRIKKLTFLLFLHMLILGYLWESLTKITALMICTMTVIHLNLLILGHWRLFFFNLSMHKQLTLPTAMPFLYCSQYINFYIYTNNPSYQSIPLW